MKRGGRDGVIGGVRWLVGVQGSGLVEGHRDLLRMHGSARYRSNQVVPPTSCASIPANARPVTRPFRLKAKFHASDLACLPRYPPSHHLHLFPIPLDATSRSQNLVPGPGVIAPNWKAYVEPGRPSCNIPRSWGATPHTSLKLGYYLRPQPYAHFQDHGLPK